MPAELSLHPDRLFPSDPEIRAIARRLYGEVKGLPIVSPHGHTDPSWFADNDPFPNPTELLLVPDHYLFRMLYSQGIRLEDLGVRPCCAHPGHDHDHDHPVADPRTAWRTFAKHYHLFLGTPSRIWCDWVFHEVFGLDAVLSEATADTYFDTIQGRLESDDYRPRALFERFGIEVIATTEDPLDPLTHHQKLKADGWGKKVVTAFRPDNVLDPDYEGFRESVRKLGEITGKDTASYQGYIDALEDRRAYFREHGGATSTDHGHATAATFDLSRPEAEALFARVISGQFSPEEAETFRGHMLTEMARMSIEDGMVMQIHPGSCRNHNWELFEKFGRNMGADIPMRTDYVSGLQPMLNKYGNDPRLSVIVFTLDETTYSRELAPLAGHYPAMKLGPAWWFHDSPEGMRRFREQTTETAGFYNTVGFNDDTRAFLSIPARHDVARRMDCGFLARMVAEHRMTEDEAHTVAHDLSYRLAKEAYKL